MSLLLLALLGCGESMTSIDVVHDVGRLCVAHVACSKGQPCAERVGFERSNMRSKWGQRTVPELLSSEPIDWAPLVAGIKASGASSSAPSCAALQAAAP